MSGHTLSTCRELVWTDSLILRRGLHHSHWRGGGIFSEFCVTNDFAWVFFFFHFLRTHPVVWRSQKTVKIGLFLFIRLFDYIKTCYKHAVYCTDDGKNQTSTDFFFFSFNPYWISPKRTLSDLVVFFFLPRHVVNTRSEYKKGRGKTDVKTRKPRN